MLKKETFEEWKEDWHLYTQESVLQNRYNEDSPSLLLNLAVKIGEPVYRVMIGEHQVYLGGDIDEAIESYNYYSQEPRWR